jgi:hypothetical protein
MRVSGYSLPSPKDTFLWRRAIAVRKGKTTFMFRFIPTRAAARALSLLAMAGLGFAESSSVLADTFLPSSVQGMQAINGNSPGRVDFLRVKTSALGIEERVVAVFDIAALGAIGGNTLNFFVDYDNFNDPSFPESTLNIYAFSGNTGASIFQWDNGSPVGSFTEHAGRDLSGHVSWLTLDVTSWLANAAAAGDQYMGFNFRAPCCSSAPSNPAANLDEARINISNPIPEPETYAMLLAGFGILGIVARRRKNIG